MYAVWTRTFIRYMCMLWKASYKDGSMGKTILVEIIKILIPMFLGENMIVKRINLDIENNIYKMIRG